MKSQDRNDLLATEKRSKKNIYNFFSFVPSFEICEKSLRKLAFYAFMRVPEWQMVYFHCLNIPFAFDISVYAHIPSMRRRHRLRERTAHTHTRTYEWHDGSGGHGGIERHNACSQVLEQRRHNENVRKDSFYFVSFFFSFYRFFFLFFFYFLHFAKV